jgi:putative hydrolase of the HAD superfamily
VSRTRLVAFDLDDTLYVEMDFVKSGFRAVAAALSDRTDIDGEDLYRDLCDVLNRDGRGKVFDTVLDRHSLQGTTPGELVSIYRNHEPALELPTDSRKVLVRLRNRGHALAIVTDGDPGVQRAKVRALGLEELVDMAIYTWDEGPEAGKPSPKGFERLLGATGSKPGDLMYVADDPRKDFLAARRAGGSSIRVRTGPYASLEPSDRSCSPDYEVTQLMAIPELLCVE